MKSFKGSYSFFIWKKQTASSEVPRVLRWIRCERTRRQLLCLCPLLQQILPVQGSQQGIRMLLPRPASSCNARNAWVIHYIVWICIWSEDCWFYLTGVVDLLIPVLRYGLSFGNTELNLILDRKYEALNFFSQEIPNFSEIYSLGDWIGSIHIFQIGNSLFVKLGIQICDRKGAPKMTIKSYLAKTILTKIVKLIHIQFLFYFSTSFLPKFPFFDSWTEDKKKNTLFQTSRHKAIIQIPTDRSFGDVEWRISSE